MIGGHVFGGGVFPNLQQGALLNPIEYQNYVDRVAADSGTLKLDANNTDRYLRNAIRAYKRNGLLDNSSLLIIPSAVKSGKLYSVLPNDGTGDFVYTRTGNKWVRNNLGAYAVNGAGLPALDWDGSKYRYSAEVMGRNVFANPSTPATQTITVTNANVYGVSIKGSGSATLSGAATGVITESTPIVITTSGTSLTVTLSGTVTHCQVENFTNAITTPIFGTSATNDRQRDVSLLTGASSLIGQSEGTVFVDIDYSQIYPANNGSICSIWENSSNRIYLLLLRSTTYISVNAYVQASGSLTGYIESGKFPVDGGNLKIAFAYKENDFALFVNGVLQGTDTSGAVPSTSKINLGSGESNGGQPNEYINCFALSKSRLSNSDLINITSVSIPDEVMLSEATALFERMDSEPSKNLKNFINDAISDLKTAGIWDKLDKLVFSNLHTWKSSLLDFKGGRGMFPRGTWTAKTGFAYGGDRGYVDTLFRPSGNENQYTSTENNNYSVDDAMVAVYSQTNIIPGAGFTANLIATVIQPGDDANGPITAIRLTSANIEYCLNEPVADIKTLAHSNSVSGLIVLERGLDNSLDLYKNGVKTSVASDEAVGFPANELRILQPPTSGNTIGMFAAGKSLGALNAEFYRIVNKFMIQVSSGLPSDLKTGRYQTTQPMLTIRMDDGYASQYDGWKTLFDSYNVKPAWAILTDVIDGLAENYPSHASWANVEAAYADGWEITLHGEADVSMTDLTIEQMQSQILSAKSKLESHGIEVLHYNMHNYSFASMYAREIGARYFRSVSAGWGFTLPSETNPNIIDPYNLSGMAVDIGTLNGSPAYSLVTPEGIALLKAQLDVAAANNRWAIIIVHGYSAEKAVGMAEIIEYAQSLNINFVTHEEAMNSCTLI